MAMPIGEELRPLQTGSRIKACKGEGCTGHMPEPKQEEILDRIATALESLNEKLDCVISNGCVDIRERREN